MSSYPHLTSGYHCAKFPILQGIKSLGGSIEFCYLLCRISCGGKYSPVSVTARTVVICCLSSDLAIGMIFVLHEHGPLSSWYKLKSWLVPIENERWWNIVHQHFCLDVRWEFLLKLFKVCNCDFASVGVSI